MHVALQADRTWWVAPLHLLSESLPADRQAFTCATFFLPLWLGPCGLWLLMMWSWLGFDGFPSLPQPFQRRVKAQLLRRDRQIWVAPAHVCLSDPSFVCLIQVLFACSLLCLSAPLFVCLLHVMWIFNNLTKLGFPWHHVQRLKPCCSQSSTISLPCPNPSPAFVTLVNLPNNSFSPNPEDTHIEG